MSHPTSTTPIKIVGLREVCEVNGHFFTRRRGTQQWSPFEPGREDLPPADVEHIHLYLSLVQEKQGPDEPLHWSLFVAYENQPGLVYQVTGDAEHMTYVPSNEFIDMTSSADFLTLYQLATVTEQQATVVKEVADHECPPRAACRREVKENCQGWAVRVIAKLVERGIVPRAKLEMAESMMEPV